MRNRHGNHTVTRFTVHLVWITKYRYHVLKGEIQKRCRELLIQVCDNEDVRILKGVVSKDHHVCFKKSFLSWAKDIGESKCGELAMANGVQEI